MSSPEKPKTIDQALRGKVLTVGPEQIAALTEEEILGLDKPVHELVARGQSLMVPKAVCYLCEAKDPAVPELFLGRFSLNSRLYNSEKNPAGLFTDIPLQARGRETLVRNANLHLLGVRAEERQQFFGENEGAGKLRGMGSPAFKDALRLANHQRETFPFRHLDRFPGIQKSLAEIEQLSGLTPEEIFTEGCIPSAFLWRAPGTADSRARAHGHPVLLEEVLRILAQALSGSMTASDIAKSNHRKPGALSYYLTGGGGRYKTFNDRTLKVIQDKIKRGRPR
ncbi:hypothetical protein HYW59_02210 [Candidatus Kaiserbacteria bacterium]|nr:hypothetical protein [Candidatus Kaiserbacteria bacterium]